MRKKKKMLSIKKKIIFTCLAIIMELGTIIGCVAVYINYSGLMNNLDLTLEQTVNVGTEYIEAKFHEFKDLAIETGMSKDIANSKVSLEQKKEIMEDKTEIFEVNKYQILDSKGKNIFNNSEDESSTEFFKKSMEGETVVTQPLDTGNGQLNMYISAPLWKNGKKDTKVIGVVVFVLDGTYLTDIIKNIKCGESGTTYILNKDGDVIAHPDYTLVESKSNTIDDAKKDKALKKLAEHETNMIKGKQGFGRYTYGGITKLISYTSIKNTDGWSLAITCGYNEFMASATKCAVVVLIITAILMILSAGAAIFVANKISEPVKSCTNRLEKLANGDLSSPMPTINTDDETKLLAESTEGILNRFSSMIGDVGYMLEDMSNGNFDVNSNAKEDYVGDFRKLLDTIYEIRDSLSKTISQINEAADQVSSGSEQVSMAAGALAQGATEQAASVNELEGRVNTINDNIKNNAKNAMNAKLQSENAGGKVLEANRQMEQMIDAMNDISEKSNQIAKIIKTIDDIAFQTNILALNAAVEAARAGEAGKGFSVVADEVRNLAGKSAEAAQDTANLIEQSVVAVSNGKVMADETAKAILSVVEDTKNVGNLVDNIVFACNKQEEESEMIKVSTDEIDRVVQTNSATSQESAAAAEELNGQAMMLKELVSFFNVRKEEYND